MSNRSCNRCKIGKLSLKGLEEICKKCILHSHFERSWTLFRIINPPVKDDRLVKVKERPFTLFTPIPTRP